MRIDVVTLFPEMISACTNQGIVGKAFQRHLLRLYTWNPREQTRDRHRTVDDRPYGGGPGMVMKVQPLRDTLAKIRQETRSRGHAIYLSPQGRLLDQDGVRELASRPHLILVAGRYEGIDERFIESTIDAEWSIGDYVLSGGELPAMVLIDALTRLLPGALGDAESVQQDSFMGGLLDYPHYTRPERIDDMGVPEVLLSGDHQAIARWRMREALGRTWLRRPGLLAKVTLKREQRVLLDEFIQQHKADHERVEAAGASSEDKGNG